MIKAKELKPTKRPGIRLRGRDAENVTISNLKEDLLLANENSYGLPISVETDELVSGNMFNSSSEECLIITNTEHSYDYFKYCITLRKQGKAATIVMQYYGQSELTAKKAKTEERKNSHSIRGALGNAMFGVDEAAFAAEYDYYDMVENLLNEIYE